MPVSCASPALTSIACSHDRSHPVERKEYKRLHAEWYELGSAEEHHAAVIEFPEVCEVIDGW